jgi:hypothetical protein
MKASDSGGLGFMAVAVNNLVVKSFGGSPYARVLASLGAAAGGVYQAASCHSIE